MVRAASDLPSDVILFISACAIFIISIISLCLGRLVFSIGNLGSMQNTNLDGTNPFYPMVSFISLSKT